MTGARMAGFSLLEMAVALLVLGLSASIISSAYSGAIVDAERNRAITHLNEMGDSLRGFVLANRRLPCPDSNGDGWEDASSGICATGVESGRLPYRSLGLDPPNRKLYAAYGVYRNTGIDLTLVAERTGDAASSPTYRNGADYVVALNLVASQALSASHILLTGNDADQGAVDCIGNMVSHPAYWLIAPLEDKDGDGDLFDSVHTGLPDSGAVCAYASTTAVTSSRDDVVFAESTTALAGWLTTQGF